MKYAHHRGQLPVTTDVEPWQTTSSSSQAGSDSSGESGNAEFRKTDHQMGGQARYRL